MNKTLIIVLTTGLSIALGLGGAYATSRAIAVAPQDEVVAAAVRAGEQETEPTPEPDEEEPPRLFPQLGRQKWQPPGLMKKSWKRPDWPEPGWRDKRGMTPWLEEEEGAKVKRLGMDEALAQALAYAALVGEGTGEELRVGKLYEFSNGYLAIITEEGTGRGALQLLVNPVNGKVRRATGADVIWNTKYLRRGVVRESPDANTLTMAEAAARAAEEMGVKKVAGEVAADGYEFYGYYVFEFQVDGVTAGLVAVNGSSGWVWFENRLGDFIAEKDIDE